jgi:NDP-sugar pyrophosphorylase family protein
MPMAGRGSRFANAGFTTPKPLIEVDGQPMFLKALSSLDDVKATKHHTVIIRKQHDEIYNLTSLLRQALPSVNVVVTDEEPIGATADALRSRDFLKPDEGVIVMDCDLWFHSVGYNTMVEDSLSSNSDIAGGLLTFEADDPRYSYAKFGPDGIVTETAEKRVISNRAITGAYYFATAELFTNAAEQLLQQTLSPFTPEYYLSLLYNILIDEGERIQATSVDEFASFGTPEELSQYNSGR